MAQGIPNCTYGQSGGASRADAQLYWRSQTDASSIQTPQTDARNFKDEQLYASRQDRPIQSERIMFWARLLFEAVAVADFGSGAGPTNLDPPQLRAGGEDGSSQYVGRDNFVGGLPCGS
jgi:hypothetical protein